MIDIKYGQTLVFVTPETKKEAVKDEATEKAKRYAILSRMSVFERGSKDNEDLEKLRLEIAL